MGYFSNGSEGESYEDRYCSRCIHVDGCAIWNLHLTHNYDQHDNPTVKAILTVLIPRDTQGRNAECSMFKERPDNGD